MITRIEASQYRYCTNPALVELVERLQCWFPPERE